MLLLLFACQTQPPATFRWIEVDATELLTDDRLYSTVTVFDWSFDQPRDLADWIPIAIEPPAIHPEPRGMIFQVAGGFATLERPVSLAADAVDAVEVTLGYPHPATLSLAWVGDGEAFSNRPFLELHPDDGVLGKDRTYTFDLRPVPDWSGEIAALRFRFADVGGGSRVVKRIRGLRYGLSSDDLADRMSRPWKVDLGHDVRNALLAPPGAPIERRIAAAADSTLRFAYGTTAELAAPVRFRVLDGQGDRPRILFESTVDSGQARRWHEAAVDLPAASGELLLTLETLAEEPLDPTRGLPVWGHPAVVPRDPRPAPPSVLLISVDTLRPDHLSLYGYRHPTSPHLDAWARSHGAIFDNAVAQAPWTLPSHVSMLTGLSAPRHGVNYSRASAPPALTTLAERLRTAGWATAAVTGGGWFHPRFGLLQGFDRYRYWPERERELELDRGVELALRDLAHLRRPFFLFFHTFEVHDFRTRSPRPGESPGDDRRLYDQRIAYTDARLGRLLDAVESSELRRHLAIVFTSDHGESFGGEQPPGHGYLFDDNLLVPLVIELPDGRGAGTRIARQVRSIDVVPTILDAVGLPGDETLDGVSLLPAIDGDAAAPPVATSYAAEGNHGLALRIGNRWKYTFDNAVWPEHRGREALYDLDADPGERRDLGAGHPRLADLRAAARSVLATTPGVRLRFANALAESTLRFEISAPGPVISQHAVKSIDLACDCVTRSGIGELSVTVPPATRFELVLEHWDGDRLEIAAKLDTGSGGSVAFRSEVRLDDLEQPVAWAWSGSSWTAAEPGAGLSTGLEISLRGIRATGRSPIDRDAELRRSLRALGYLD
ncbi:MAG: sulfatase [Thermoanaerobaculia bacterium]